jgi:hypothetical protein
MKSHYVRRRLGEKYHPDCIVQTVKQYVLRETPLGITEGIFYLLSAVM